jgi:hypothetical protein
MNFPWPKNRQLKSLTTNNLEIIIFAFKRGEHFGGLPFFE